MQTQSYHIQQLLGQGGMAKVYLAEHKTLGHKVAIKVLNKEYVHNENIRKRFLSEARNLAKMNHPHVVRVIDLIEEGDMVAFVMEYIDGQTLRDYLDQKGKLPDDEIKKLFGQMLEAVGYVHEQGLVHRDIKPSNFMLDSRGNIKLLDFGIAKTLDASSAEHTETGTGLQMGTPMYMSPEQVKSTKDVTRQSDIYSLGVVLWQMAAGRKPYDTSTFSTFEIQTRIVNEPLPEIGTSWDTVIKKATEKDLKSRFKSIQNVILEKPKTQKLQKPKSNGPDETVVQTNWGSQEKVKPTPIGWDKNDSTNKNSGRDKSLGFGFWVFIITTILISVSIYFIINPIDRTSKTDIETSKQALSDTVAVNELINNLVVIEGGTFTMGCITSKDSNCENDEYPNRQVTLDEFGINKFEVTQYQWESIMGSIPEQAKKCPKCPVEGIARNEIQSFLDVLNSKITGPKFNLPTEAQWEFAARGGNFSKGYIYSGSDSYEEVGWVGDTNSIYQEVGLKKSNELGLFDMTGNVFEICRDWYDSYVTNQIFNPTGPSIGSKLVERGGSFYHGAKLARNTYRGSIESTGKGNLVGFRLVVNPEIENSTDSTAAAH